jgi:hypothetical protein
MPVLTQKELLEKGQLTFSNNLNTSIVEEKSANNPVITKNVVKEPIKETVCEYTMMHPENGVFDRKNYSSEIVLDGEKFSYACVEGIVKTKSDALAECLYHKGFIFLKEVVINV